MRLLLDTHAFLWFVLIDQNRARSWAFSRERRLAASSERSNDK
jgi:PIN domain nuclease of toxin-antitoxin system